MATREKALDQLEDFKNSRAVGIVSRRFGLQVAPYRRGRRAVSTCMCDVQCAQLSMQEIAAVTIRMYCLPVLILFGCDMHDVTEASEHTRCRQSLS
jgi:hypothetical protein